MKKYVLMAAIAAAATAHTTPAAAQAAGYPIDPVAFTQVKVAPGTFWGQRLEASRQVTVPLAFSKCEETGRYANFENAARHLKDPARTFAIAKGTFSFDDTDPYKTIEGASYLLQTYPDRRLRHYVDSIVDIIATAQEPDGYLYTSRTQNPQQPHPWAGSARWVKEEDLSHELYNLGHMIEGAIAHYQATGSRRFLDVAIRYADCVCREVGPGQGQACVVPGHQIAEMALAKLYLATGQRRYLDEAKFFLDYRGRTTIRHSYSQAHRPVAEQDEAVGHAVRAAYMYAGMADVAALTGDTAYLHAIDRIWQNIVERKLYITGGIGATASGEAFGRNYELPNMSAYCETCAAIGLVYVNYRLFLLHGESKYYDVLERTLYNGLISGVSLDGGAFFYPNPLESMGQHQRQPWFGCACCPSNICRFIPSLPGYVYAVRQGTGGGQGAQSPAVYVNLYLTSQSTLSVDGRQVGLSQTTDYPWQGDIGITIDRNQAGTFDLKLRIPGWVGGQPVPGNLYSYSDNVRLGATCTLNGASIDVSPDADGYLTISRRWKRGDRVQLHFDMAPRTVRALNDVEADRGMVAIERGPLVYCAEHPDNDFDLGSLLLNQRPSFALGQTTIAGQPVTTIETPVQTLGFDGEGRLATTSQRLTLVPYYAWNHRGPGRMRVWMAQDLSATRPARPATLASRAKAKASIESPSLSAVNDRLVPTSADDRSVPYLHWWPRKGTTEWVQYELDGRTTVGSATLYWFDDGPWGGCRVPKSWRLLYRDGQGQWQPVANATTYGCLKGQANTVRFEPVATDALKLEVQLPDDNSAGVFEWEIGDK